MPTLRIYLFGDLQIYVENRPLTAFKRPKSKALLAYLVLGRERMFSRSILGAHLWPDLSEVRARKALNTEIWRTSKVFRDADIDPAEYLMSDNEGVGFKLEGVVREGFGSDDACIYGMLRSEAARWIGEEDSERLTRSALGA